MKLGLENKKVLITGGAIGIGKGLALGFAEEGAQVLISSRKQENIDQALPAIKELSPESMGLVSQLTEEGEPKAFAEEVKSKFGNPDILINNAGHTLDITDPYCSIEDWRSIMRLNFEVAVELSNEFLPHMKKENWGRILNVSSLASLENSGPVTYCVSKAALSAYTRSMGRVLAIESPGVVMTALMPGIVKTEGGHWDRVMKERPEHAEKYIKERCPSGRFGEIDEITPTVLFLCSEQASFSHGAIVPVDGGQSRHYMYFNYLD